MIGKLINIFLVYILIFNLLLFTFLLGDVEHLRITLLLICLILSIFYFREIQFTKLSKINYSVLNAFIEDILKNYSSLSLTISSLFWRLYIFISYPKEVKAIIALQYALSGTFFSN